MSRTVVTFQTPRGQGCQFFLKSPPDDSGAIEAFDMASEIDGRAFNAVVDDTVAEIVQKVGQSLASVLARHKGIKEELKQLVLRSRSRKSLPIYFEINADDADESPWEALYYENRFFALDPHLPIGRMCAARGQLDAPEQYVTLKPLRVLAVLPTDETGVSEFKMLREAFTNKVLRDENTPVELHVLTADSKLMDEINGSGVKNLRAASIEASSSITDYMKQLRPKLVHISCDWIEQASPIMKMVGSDNHDVYLEAEELRDFGDPNQLVWLIMLSCTDGQGRVKNSNHLARWLVRNGFPTAVGMRGSTDRENLRAFYIRFYREALNRINDVPFGGRGQEIEWTELLVQSRRQILHQPPGKDSCTHWTLPVLYCRQTPFRMCRFDAWDTQHNIGVAAEIRGLYRIYDELSQSEISDKGALMQSFMDRIAEAEKRFEDQR